MQKFREALFTVCAVILAQALHDGRVVTLFAHTLLGLPITSPQDPTELAIAAMPMPQELKTYYITLSLRLLLSNLCQGRVTRSEVLRNGLSATFLIARSRQPSLESEIPGRENDRVLISILDGYIADHTGFITSRGQRGRLFARIASATIRDVRMT